MMTVLYMAQTINGMIAYENDDTAFVSDAGWDFYKQLVEDSGAIVMGRKTYDVMVTENSIEYLQGKTIVVLSHTPQDSGRENVFITNDAPEQIITNLRETGCEQIFISGGGITNTSFLRSGLVDEMIIDIEPKLLGSGISLCSHDQFEVDMTLVKTERFGDNSVRLFYTVDHK